MFPHSTSSSLSCSKRRAVLSHVPNFVYARELLTCKQVAKTRVFHFHRSSLPPQPSTRLFCCPCDVTHLFPSLRSNSRHMYCMSHCCGTNLNSQSLFFQPVWLKTFRPQTLPPWTRRTLPPNTDLILGFFTEHCIWASHAYQPFHLFKYLKCLAVFFNCMEDTIII